MAGLSTHIFLQNTQTVLTRCRSLEKIFERPRRFLLRSKKTILLIFLVAFIIISLRVLFAVRISSSHGFTVRTAGTIFVTGVGAYGGDLKSSNGIVFINLGAFELGDSKNVSFYLRNTSDVPITLAFDVTDWNPEGMRTYVNLSWNYTGAQLAPGEETPVEFSLTTSYNIDFANYLIKNNLTSFNFEIHIYALR